jgi:hypothetical protein
MRPVSNSTRMKSAASATARNVTSSPGLPPDDAPIGSWLCDEGTNQCLVSCLYSLKLISGPYRRYIEALSGSNPGLKKADPNNKGPLIKENAKVVLLDSPAIEQTKYEKTEFRNSGKLREHFEHSPRAHSHRRIYLMEGLAPDFVAVLGGHFFMEPTFFQRQERTCVWSNDFTPVSDALPQPSLLSPNKSFHLQYCELRQFNKALENRYYFCQRTRRHVGMTAARHKEESTTGILRRKLSWWCRETSDGGWDGRLPNEIHKTKLTFA